MGRINACLEALHKIELLKGLSLCVIPVTIEEYERRNDSLRINSPVKRIS